MVTLLERERDVVRGKADVLRATSGKISNALEKERNSFKTAKENKKEKATTSDDVRSVFFTRLFEHGFWRDLFQRRAHHGGRATKTKTRTIEQ